MRLTFNPLFNYSFINQSAQKWLLAMENENNGNNRFQEKLEHRAQKTPQLKVLVVDDDPSILELLKTALTTIDSYNVTIANSAESAIDALEAATTPFDCLLLDIQMPDTDGIVLLRGIRALPDYSETPIIMLTAMSERSYVDDAFMAGATDYVCKPFDLLDLRGRMNSARRLVKERLKTEKSLRSVKILKQELENNQQFNFEDPLTIDDADRCLRYVEFDNYVGQLSRGRLFNSYAIAIKLQDASILYDITSCGCFRRVVHDTAHCIQSATSEIDCIFSYRGEGVFLVVVHEEMPSAQFPTEEKLNNYVSVMLRERHAAAWVHVLVGEPVSMRSLSRSGASTAMSRAVTNVEEREEKLREKNSVLSGAEAEVEVATDGSTEPRKRMYERVLMELFGEESYLSMK
ncbi:MAG: response regulator transcription factor [Pseudomonadota bacterium]